MEIIKSNYIEEKVIGRGMFSQVSKGKCLLSNKVVALKKIILSNLDPKTVNNCIKEIQLLQHLNHDNIIKYLDSYQEDQTLIIILEFADHGDLGSVINYFKNKRRLIFETTIWKFFCQITSGLEHMHSRRIMHRDIKPANVFITSEGVVKIGDFGLSRYLSEMTLETFSLLGSPYYMSPERLQQGGYTFSSDIWSLGCLLYEMAALQPPFFPGEKNLILLSKKILLGLYPPIPNPNYSSEINQLVKDCLQSDHTLRPSALQIHSRATAMFSKISVY